MEQKELLEKITKMEAEIASLKINSKKSFKRKLIVAAASVSLFFIVISASVTIPNTIANGDNLDATKVMANFNAVANAFGTLTSGYIPYWNGSALANSGIYSDGTKSGIGTTSPAREFHIAGASAAEMLFEQTTAIADGKKWNLFTNGGNGSTASNFKVRLLNDALSSGPVYLTILGSSGNVGIGTETPGYLLHVNGTLAASGSTISASYSTWSDGRYKEKISTLDNQLDKIEKVKSVSYFWKKDKFTEKFPTTKQIGFIAQDIEKIYPELVTIDNKGYKAVEYGKFAPILVEAVKELNAKNGYLKKENAELKKQNQQMMADVKMIKEKLGIK